MWMIPHCLGIQLTDGGEVLSLTRRLSFPSREIPDAYFCYRPSRLQGHSAAGRITSQENLNYCMRNRTCDLTVCSLACQPTTVRLQRGILLRVRLNTHLCRLSFSIIRSLSRHISIPFARIWRLVLQNEQFGNWRMQCSGIWRRVALIRTDVS
jgi:hypothetical protein